MRASIGAVSIGLFTALGCGGLGTEAAPTDPAAYACDEPGCTPSDPLAIETLMGMAMGSPQLSAMLRDDGDIAEDAHIRMNQRLKDGAELDWAMQQAPGDVLQATSTMDPVVANLAVFSRVRGEDPGEWQYVVDSTGEDACGRGPLGLTYRQARNLGLDQVQPAAVLKQDVANGEDAEVKHTALKAASSLDGDEPDFAGVSLQVSEPVRGTRVCVFATGPDDRTDPAALGAMLVEQLGAEASDVPDPSDSYAIPGRLAKLFAADLPSGFGELSFADDQRIDDLLANQDVSRDGRRHVTGEVAHAIGAAIAIRCRTTTKDPENALEPYVTACAELLSRMP